MAVFIYIRVYGASVNANFEIGVSRRLGSSGRSNEPYNI